MPPPGSLRGSRSPHNGGTVAETGEIAIASPLDPAVSATATADEPAPLAPGGVSPQIPGLTAAYVPSYSSSSNLSHPDSSAPHPTSRVTSSNPSLPAPLVPTVSSPGASSSASSLTPPPESAAPSPQPQSPKEPTPPASPLTPPPSSTTSGVKKRQRAPPKAPPKSKKGAGKDPSDAAPMASGLKLKPSFDEGQGQPGVVSDTAAPEPAAKPGRKRVAKKAPALARRRSSRVTADADMDIDDTIAAAAFGTPEQTPDPPAQPSAEEAGPSESVAPARKATKAAHARKPVKRKEDDAEAANDREVKKPKRRRIVSSPQEEPAPDSPRREKGKEKEKKASEIEDEVESEGEGEGDGDVGMASLPASQPQSQSEKPADNSGSKTSKSDKAKTPDKPAAAGDKPPRKTPTAGGPKPMPKLPKRTAGPRRAGTPGAGAAGGSSAAAAPARPSLLASTLASLSGKSSGGPAAGAASKAESVPERPRAGAWTDEFVLTPEQEAQFAACQTRRAYEAGERVRGREPPLKMQAAKDAYRADHLAAAARGRAIMVQGNMGILTTDLASQLVAAVLAGNVRH